MLIQVGHPAKNPFPDPCLAAMLRAFQIAQLFKDRQPQPVLEVHFVS